ncbi:FecCD family ABC transporter permease [Roseibium aggregatum]|uniref:Iron ABC transporter permease n=1 Tax=Roseibium aggregatum TaxID=187304 RepID=A0A939EC45_9HYPH|nr:iron ABC transporter permease [Roseibium aggregatum]MBN9668889.1 iron ABC transporter permease [Roseibium aggregatum]
MSTRVPVGADRLRLIALVTLCCLLPLAAIWSVSLGATVLPLDSIINAIFAFDGSRDHLVVAAVRLPRVLAGLLVGGALAIAGAIMQAITNNPLASPGLLGINAGAAFAVVFTMSVFGTGAQGSLVWTAFAGAGAAAVLVSLFGSTGPMSGTPVKLVLAGAVLTAFLTSLTTAFLIMDRSTLDSVRLWTAGSLTGRTMDEVRAVAPYMLAGLAAALVFPRQLTVLSLGADVSRSLGQNPVFWRGVAAVIVILLAGSAVALAGPIGFVGLIVPHIVRLTVGTDYKWIIPFAAAGGAFLVLSADTLSRLLFASQSFPVGVTMATIGAPFFIWLARTSPWGRS